MHCYDVEYWQVTRVKTGNATLNKRASPNINTVSSLYADYHILLNLPDSHHASEHIVIATHCYTMEQM